MSSAVSSPRPDRLHLISGADIRAHIITGPDDVIRAAARAVAGWTLHRGLAEVQVAARRRGATVTALGDPAVDNDPVLLLPAQRGSDTLVTV